MGPILIVSIANLKYRLAFIASGTLQAMVPPCSGTKEFIEYLEEEILSVSVARYHALYNKVPLDTACKVWMEIEESSFAQSLHLNNGKSAANNRDIKNMCEGIKKLKNTEIMYVTLFLQKLITYEYFELGVRQHLGTESIATEFLEAAKDILLASRNSKVSQLSHLLIHIHT